MSELPRNVSAIPLSHPSTKGSAFFSEQDPSDERRWGGNKQTMLAIIRLAAMFHDMGKATNLFQRKLHAALNGAPAQADALRHELVSALAWDELAKGRNEVDLLRYLQHMPAGDLDAAMVAAALKGAEIFRGVQDADRDGKGVEFAFLSGPPTALAVGLLVLGHHRQPMLSLNGTQPTTGNHCNPTAKLAEDDLQVAPGTLYWHEPHWIEGVWAEAARIGNAGVVLPLLDLHGRAALMLADHFGSASKETSDPHSQIANTNRTADGKVVAADSLFTHVQRVTDACCGSFDALVTARGAYPALQPLETPQAILKIDTTGRFGWQGRAAARAGELCASGDGGFFACVIAGTGSGKTRAAPAILAAACFNDPDPSRRRLRFTLGLGLRTLATQSGREYLEDLGFSSRDVSVMVGQAEIEFRDDARRPDAADLTGSGDMLGGLDPANVLPAGEDTLKSVSGDEADWQSDLSHDPAAALPDFVGAMALKEGARGGKLSQLARSPIICATVDHIISAASPERSRHLAASLRIITSDLILDEVDQYGPEDLAVVARLAYLVGAAGHRLIIMSATVTADIAEALHEAYASGWSAHASVFRRADRVHTLCLSDREGALSDNAEGAEFATCFKQVAATTNEYLEAAPSPRRAEILPDVSASELPALISRICSEMHDRHSSPIEGFQVSAGFVRLTRVGHTAAVAARLPQPADRLRAVICLHSRFPRIGRSWIERQLKRALTRKGEDPDAGLRQLASEEGLFEAARTAGHKDIEIVLVCSPVIETGNDLDFDYAVLDPSSTRSIVQAAGRVQRHRGGCPDLPNIAILARPLVTLFDDRKLSMPGVETKPAPITMVNPVNLNKFNASSRTTSLLLEMGTGASIDARMVNGPAASAPLPRAEAELCRRHLFNETASIREWTGKVLARHGARQSRVRRFRRENGFNVLAWREGRSLSRLNWFWNRYPGRRPSAPPERDRNIDLAPKLTRPLFQDFLERAWAAHTDEKEITSLMGQELLGVSWASNDPEILPDLLFSEDLGMFRQSSLEEFEG